MVISVEQAFKEISGLIFQLGGYSRPGEFDEKVNKVIKNLPTEEIPELTERLEGLKRKEREEYNQEVSNIQAQADHSIAFGGGLSISMSDYYDNEVSAASVDCREKIARIDSVIGELELIQCIQESRDFISWIRERFP